MTDQLYTVAPEFFDNNSSNSSNLLRFELFGGSVLGTAPPATLTSAAINSTTGSASISIPHRNNGDADIYQPRIMADFSELGLDALDASSISPNLIQDVNLNGMGGSTYNNTQFNVGNFTGSNSGDNVILYEMQASNPGSNSMWSDIGNAMITTKSEPFLMDDDYIFQIDKSDLIQGPTLAELNDETLLEDLNIDEFIKTEQGTYMIAQNEHMQTLQSSLVNMHNSSSNLSTNFGSVDGLNQQQQQIQQQQSHLVSQQQQHNLQQEQQQHHLQLSPDQLTIQLSNDGLYDEIRTTGSSSPYDIFQTTPTKSVNSSAAFSPVSQASSSSPLMLNSTTPPPHTSRSQMHYNLMHHTTTKARSTALHELLKKEYSMSPDRRLGQSVPGPSNSNLIISGTALSPGSSGCGSARKAISPYSLQNPAGPSRLSSSAPTHLGMEQIWQRREPRQHLLSTGSLAEAESFSSISTGSVLSPEAQDFSHDEGYSDFDSDHYEDFSSDNDSDNEDTPRAGGPHSSKNGKERYFWQYNVQAKGPKGQRLVIKSQLEDPHVLNEVTDPVFSPNCSVRGIKHSGKARKGDGNDLTPNPRKLNAIGKELDKLGRTINDMTPVSELPFAVRPKSRKEKNKLASRACRLKKKAQHEANKIKLYGLELEHKRLLNGIADVKRILAIKYQNPNENSSDLNQEIDNISVKSTKIKIAGQSTEFVNKILDKIKTGVPNGGLDELKNT